MCGIIGAFHKENSVDLVKKGLSLMKNRGSDGSDFVSFEDNCVGHSLHAVVNHVKQPLQGEGMLVANCEIYNWQSLKNEAKNDADALLQLLDEGDFEDVLGKLDGVYAFAYVQEKKVYLARDLFGVKSLWYSVDGFAFASERKVLEQLGYSDIQELNPRKYLVYDLEEKKWGLHQRSFVYFSEGNGESLKVSKEKIKNLLLEAIQKRIPKQKIGILFSGGLDSYVLMEICKQHKIDFHCYATVVDGMSGEDGIYLEKANSLGIPLSIVRVSKEEIKESLKRVVPLIEDNNVVKVGVALVNYFACQEASKDGVKVMFSGLGADEIFGGYHRFLSATSLNSDCYSSLLKMYERDLYRDDVISMEHKLELRLPFLDKSLVEEALKLNPEFKIKGERRKIILREIAKDLGVPEEFAERAKKAGQYGSGMDKALSRIAKVRGFKRRSEYLKQFYDKGNVRLGVLFSGGKDSTLAASIMGEQHYELGCLITMRSKNEHSYMFHTPAIDLVSLQAEAMNLPLVMVETEGGKEKELEDLKAAFVEAKEEYKIEGVVVGALFSEYQRQRVERICDELSLKIFTPLWHMDQEAELRELLRRDFEVILTGIAADGLDESWLGRRLDKKMIEDLKKLEMEHSLNVAGEGGEFESLVLDCDLFTKKIEILESEKKMDSEQSGVLEIKEAKLL